MSPLLTLYTLDPFFLGLHVTTIPGIFETNNPEQIFHTKTELEKQTLKLTSMLIQNNIVQML